MFDEENLPELIEDIHGMEEGELKLVLSSLIKNQDDKNDTSKNDENDDS